MGIENLKRWHWILIGLALGLVLAYAQIGIGTDNLVAGGQHSSMSQETFERMLDGPSTERGQPVIADLRVYCDGAKFLVKMRHLGPDPNDPKNGRARKYENLVLTTRVPFAPVHDTSKTIEVEILPAYADPRTGKNTSVVKINSNSRPVAAQFSGWSRINSMVADPGADAQVKFALTPGRYLLKVQAPDASAADMAQVAVELNGHALAPLGAMPAPPPDAGSAAPSKGMWQTQVPAALLSGDKQQTLRIARGATPVRIRELWLVNSTYSVLDYLKDRQATHKQLTFRYAWWTQTRSAIALWTIGSVVLVGGIWPTIIHLLTGAGLSRAPADRKYDLSRVKSGSASSRKGAPVATQEDAARLAALATQMEAKLKVSAGVAPAAAPAAPVPETVRALANAAPADDPAPKQTEEQLEFKEDWEFYPVVRNPSERRPGTGTDESEQNRKQT